METRKKLRAALYARVSTDKCDICGKNKAAHGPQLKHPFKGQDPERQLRELREYAESRSWSTTEFVDRDSGSKESRPELDRMWSESRRRRFDVVVVHDYDRMGRTVKQLVIALAEFQSLGIDFVAISKGIDTTTPQGRLMFHIIVSFAEFEREMIRERVVSGLANARSKGKRLGRPQADLSFLASNILAMRENGETWRAISQQTGVSIATLKRRARSGSKTPESLVP